jgi:hypothetical protein
MDLHVVDWLVSDVSSTLLSILETEYGLVKPTTTNKLEKKTTTTTSTTTTTTTSENKDDDATETEESQQQLLHQAITHLSQPAALQVWLSRVSFTLRTLCLSHSALSLLWFLFRLCLISNISLPFCLFTLLLPLPLPLLLS